MDKALLLHLESSFNHLLDYCRKKAEEKAQEKKEEELAKVSKEEREETKNRAGSLPSIETKIDILNLGIPEPAALKNKALSTG